MSEGYVNPIFEAMLRSIFGEVPYPEHTVPPEEDTDPKTVILDLFPDQNGEYKVKWLR